MTGGNHTYVDVTDAMRGTRSPSGNIGNDLKDAFLRMLEMNFVAIGHLWADITTLASPLCQARQHIDFGHRHGGLLNRRGVIRSGYRAAGNQVKVGHGGVVQPHEILWVEHVKLPDVVDLASQLAGYVMQAVAGAA